MAWCAYAEEVCVRDFLSLCCSKQLQTKPACMQEPDLLDPETPYDELDLNEEPVIVLACGHLWTRASLDGIMELHKAYDVTEDGAQPMLSFGAKLPCPAHHVLGHGSFGLSASYA